MSARALGRTAGCGAVAGALIFASCTSVRAPESDARKRAPAISIASFNFPESELLAYIYGLALQEKGFPIEFLAGAGTRELLQPALARGLIQLIPEYQGSALAFLTLGLGTPSPDVGDTHRALQESLDRLGIVALDPAPAQDANAIVVTAQVAARYGLRAISDLARVAPRLRFGGPSECEQRRLCLQGLRQRYGLQFKEFIPLDTGGPLTVGALQSRQVDVALLFTTDPAITSNHLVELIDDRDLQPAENVTPLVSRSTLERSSDTFKETLNSVSARLTTDLLRALNGRTSSEGISPRTVAAEWLRSQALLGART